MEITREALTDVLYSLNINIEAEDYQPDVEKELMKLSSKAQIKGFRKGNVPKSLLKKMYGDATKKDVVLRMLNEELNKYLMDQELDLIINPLMNNERSADLDFSIKSEEPILFSFDLLLTPEVELSGISADDTYETYKITVEDEKIDESLETLKKQHGTTIEVEEDIADNDILTLVAKELDEDGSVVNNGYVTDFKILVTDKLYEEVKDKVMGKGLGDTFTHNIYQLVKERDEKFVKKHFLNLDDDEEREIGTDFQFTIDEISRRKEAELNEEFWTKVFGEESEIKTEEEGRERIAEFRRSTFSPYVNGYLFDKMNARLMSENEFDIPDEFVKQLIIREQENGQLVNDETISANKKSIKWELIKRIIKKTYDISVSEAEIKEDMRRKVMNMLQQNNMMQILEMQGEEFVTGTVEKLYEDKQGRMEHFENILSGKIVKALQEVVTLEEIPISEEDFTAMVEKDHGGAQEEE